MANTSRIVERVAAVLDSRHALLSASVQAYTERRDRIFAGAIAIGSLLALPPTLLLAYFGTNSTNVNQHFLSSTFVITGSRTWWRGSRSSRWWAAPRSCGAASSRSLRSGARRMPLRILAA